ncbi:MAG: hypothetical protein AAFN91_10280 [Pseudomonadota bacterium]
MLSLDRMGQPTPGLFRTLSNLVHYGQQAASVQKDYMARQAAKEAQRAIDANEVSNRMGNARIGEAADFDAMGWRAPAEDPHGPLLGFDENGDPVFLNDDTHIVYSAPPGFGKTWQGLVPMLVSLALGPDHQKQGTISLDLKSELYLSTAVGLATAYGRESLAHNPFGVNGIPSVDINPFSDFPERARMGEPIVEDVSARLMLFFQERMKAKGESAWITKAAKYASDCLMVSAAFTEPENCNLAALADVSMMERDVFIGIFEDMMKSEDLAGGFVSSMARKIVADYGRQDEWSMKACGWIQQEIHDAFHLYQEGTKLRKQVLKTDFDFGSLKREPRAFYVICDPTMVESHGAHMAAVMAFITQQVATSEGPQRVNLVAEEAGNFPVIGSLPFAVRLYRSKGVRVIAVFQDRKAAENYKAWGGWNLFAANSVVATWAVSEAAFAADIEARAGQRAELIPTPSWSPGSGSMGTTARHEPVLSRSKVGLIGHGQTILMVPGSPVFVLNRFPWDQIPWIAPYVRDLRDGGES